MFMLLVIGVWATPMKWWLHKGSLSLLWQANEWWSISDFIYTHRTCPLVWEGERFVELGNYRPLKTWWKDIVKLILYSTYYPPIYLPSIWQPRSSTSNMLSFFAINVSMNNESITKLVWSGFPSPWFAQTLKIRVACFETTLYISAGHIYVSVYNTMITRIKNKMVLVVSQENRPLHFAHFLKLKSNFHVRNYSCETWLVDRCKGVKGKRS